MYGEKRQIIFFAKNWTKEINAIQELNKNFESNNLDVKYAILKQLSFEYLLEITDKMENYALLHYLSLYWIYLHFFTSVPSRPFVSGINVVLEREEAMKVDALLARYRSKEFSEWMEYARPIEELDTDLMLQVLDHIKVYEEWMVVVFQKGTEIE